MKRVLLIVFLSCCSANVWAQESNFYVGLGLGYANLGNSLKGNTVEDGLSVVEDTRLKISERNRYEMDDDTSLSYRAFGGYTRNENISFEFNFYDFGKIDVDQQTRKDFADGSSLTNAAEFELSVIAVALNALFAYPVNDRASLYAIVGGAWSQQERKYELEDVDVRFDDGRVQYYSTSYTHKEKESHFDFTYGLGFTIKINRSFESGFRVTGIELENGRIFDYGLNFIYRI